MDDFKPLWGRAPKSFEADRPATSSFRGGFDAIGARVITADAPAQPESDAIRIEHEAPQQQQQQYVDVEVEIAAAREAGLAEGRAQAMAELEPQLQLLQEQLEQIAPLVDAVEGARDEALREAASQVGELVVGVCGRVLGAHLAADGEAISALVQQSIARFPPDDEITIRVPTAAVESVQALLPERRVLADDALKAGCRVETRYASLESSLQTVLEGVEHAVQGWLATKP